MADNTQDNAPACKDDSMPKDLEANNTNDACRMPKLSTRCRLILLLCCAFLAGAALASVVCVIAWVQGPEDVRMLQSYSEWLNASHGEVAIADDYNIRHVYENHTSNSTPDDLVQDQQQAGRELGAMKNAGDLVTVSDTVELGKGIISTIISLFDSGTKITLVTSPLDAKGQGLSVSPELGNLGLSAFNKGEDTRSKTYRLEIQEKTCGGSRKYICRPALLFRIHFTWNRDVRYVPSIQLNRPHYFSYIEHLKMHVDTLEAKGWNSFSMVLKDSATTFNACAPGGHDYVCEIAGIKLTFRVTAIKSALGLGSSNLDFDTTFYFYASEATESRQYRDDLTPDLNDRLSGIYELKTRDSNKYCVLRRWSTWGQSGDVICDRSTSAGTGILPYLGQYVINEIEGTDSHHSIQSAATGMYCGVDAKTKVVCDRYALGFDAAYRFKFEMKEVDEQMVYHLVAMETAPKKCAVKSNDLKCDAGTGDDFLIPRKSRLYW